jgi:predicted nuclease with RNAse H fold
MKLVSDDVKGVILEQCGSLYPGGMFRSVPGSCEGLSWATAEQRIRTIASVERVIAVKAPMHQPDTAGQMLLGVLAAAIARTEERRRRRARKGFPLARRA